MTEPCTQMDKIAESKTHIDHMLPEIREIKEDVKTLISQVASMKGYATGAGAAGGFIAGVVITGIGKIFSIVSAMAMTAIR